MAALRRVVLLSLVLRVWSAAATADDLPAPLARIEPQDGVSIVFLGDSITHQCLYTQYVEDYLYTRFPNMRFKLHNAGVGGARAWDALARFDEDVAAYQPDYVTVLLGMNDGSYRPYDEATFQTYRGDMTALIDRIEEIGAKPILMTPTMFDSRAARLRDPNRNDDTLVLYNSVLTYYGTWLREVAVENGHGFVDMWGPLNNITLEQRKSDPAFTMIADSVHPDAPGQVVMAMALIEDMGLPHDVSRIDVGQTDGVANITATGGVASELSWSADEISFTFAADSLPWALPEEAQLGARITHLGHRLSRETLEVHGLPPGDYVLSIDGAEVGTYSTVQLEHLELQSNERTPQYQQALEVAMLNKQRNEGPVMGLRGEWGQFQHFARIRQGAEAAPDNADLQSQLAEMTTRVEGMAERVAERNSEARAIEDQIFEINQPAPRRYVLKRSP
jgi:lysophospholipase L1-like esterase